MLPFLEPARYKGAYGGRGSGKSHAFADMLIDDCLMVDGLRAVCIRETKTSIKHSVKQLVADKIRARGANVAAMFDIRDKWITTPGGGVIVFEGMQAHNADSIKSLEGMDRAWVEEAQAMSQRSIDMLTPTIRKPGSELWFTWNPGRPDDPIEKLLRGPKPRANSIVRPVNFTDNPWFAASPLVEDMQHDLAGDPDKYAHIWLGEFLQRSDAAVFRNWTTGEIFLDIAKVRAGELVPLFGADWGFSVDPTVLIRCWILLGEGRRQTLYIDQEAWNIGCPINAKPALFRSFEDRLVPEVRKWPIVADSASPDTISYMVAAGFRMEPAKKGPGSLEEGVEFLQSFDIVVHPRCRHAIDELVHYSYKVDKKTDTVLPILKDQDNHVIDALRYAVEKVRMARTDGMITFLADQAQTTATPPSRPDFAFALSPQPAAEARVRMIPPSGVTTIYGLSGVLYQIDSQGCMGVAPEDVGPLRMAGFLEAA